MIEVILEYYRIRLRLWEWLALAVLFSMLLFNVDTPLSEWVISIAFLWSSLLVFRLLDDIGSAQIDREDHPERTYLQAGKYKSLFKFFGLISSGYLVFWNFIGIEGTYLIGALILLQVGIYLIFKRNRTVQYLLPFLKYPVLLLCVSGLPFQDGAIMLPLGALMMMLAYDAIESQKAMLAIVIVVLSALCFFYNLGLIPLLILTVLPVIPILFLIKRKYIKYLPILYFPVAVFIFNALS